MLSEIVEFYLAIKQIDDEEIQKQLDVISFPHVKQDARKRIINRYYGDIQQQSLPGTKTMALRYASNVKKKGQEWPKGK